jgi:hypothetical protein
MHEGVAFATVAGDPEDARDGLMIDARWVMRVKLAWQHWQRGRYR